MSDAELFEAVLTELSELLLDLGDLGSRVVLIGGQVLAIESVRRGGTGAIEVATDTGVVVPRGFSMEPDLLFDLDEDDFQAERLVEVLRERGYQRQRDFRWVKPLPGGGTGQTLELDLFRRPDVAPAAVPTPMTPIPDADLVLKRRVPVEVRLGAARVNVNVPDATAFIAMKVRAKTEQRPQANKDCFDLYAYVKMFGVANVNDALKAASSVGDALRDALTELFWSRDAAGVKDVLAYAGELGDEERELLAQDVVDTFADIARR